MVLQNLKDGKSATFRSGGNSLAPLINPNDQCKYVPLTGGADDVSVGDIVFCLITPDPQHGAPYLIGHFVKQKKLCRKIH